MANSKWSSLLVIPLALIPLGIIWSANFLLYTYAGVGSHRNVYDLLRSDEDQMEAILRKVSDNCSESQKLKTPRWVGDADAPSTLVALGSSPTGLALVQAEADSLGKRLHMKLFSLWTHVTPIDRFDDRLRMLLAVSPPDVLLLEVNFTFANDFLIGFREKTETFPGPWNANQAIYNPELLDLERAIGLPADAAGNARRFRIALTQLQHQLNKNQWFEIHGHRTSYEERPLTRVSDPRLLSNHVMVYVLERIARLCRSHGVGLVVWVPPRAAPLVVFGPQGLDPAGPSRRALRFAARRWGFKVFDYDGAYKQKRLFRDAIHLNALGAERFSRRFFKDLETFLKGGASDSEYVQIEQSD